MKIIIKILLAVLFFLCLLGMPYGFFQLVRFIALIGFAVLAYLAHNEENNVETIVCIVLAVLFQPLVKIALGREIWNIIDAIVGVILIVSIFIPSKNNKKE
ncbi:MAG: hypothetical protein EZS26_000872 [Candidatus Ordinivivax streblomastigis]|uniref:Uncharacterized protein n=1 Tax=Candidatus Ordinivivax streblomastigis TaxID=2540710 RepID=A0A5M8P3C0_9BACT|nr:MAG: hypothetical protein EZS26_000872 [Candidatus Ordinivivax streblomastigis]